MNKFQWPETFQPVGFTVCLAIFTAILLLEINHMLPPHNFTTIVLDAAAGSSFWFGVGMTGALKRFNRRK